MSLGCARCGDCCDPVGLSPATASRVATVAETLGDVWTVPTDDPDLDDPSLLFAAQHWHEQQRLPSGHVNYRCDQFDPDTRTCAAHDERPPVCRDFPWYSDVIKDGRSIRDRRCSYLLDVPPELRHDDARPLIPLEVLR